MYLIEKNAVATCSKWPELQTTLQAKLPNTCSAHRPGSQNSKRKKATRQKLSRTLLGLTPGNWNIFLFFCVCDLVWLVDGPSGAKECCCCMLICHQHRFRWPPKIWAQGLPPYRYLSIVYESQAWLLSDFHPKAWCSRSGSRFEVWLYTEWLCDL